MLKYSQFPTYSIVEETQSANIINVITLDQIETIPQQWRQDFKKNLKITIHNDKKKKINYITSNQINKFKINQDSYLKVSDKASQSQDYYGFTSDLLSSVYQFNRKSIQIPLPNIQCWKGMKNLDKIIHLAQGKNRAKQWANGRGDIEGTPKFFVEQAEEISKRLGVKLTVISGQDLLKDGFRLMHAVGRASRNTPSFINLSYNGNPDSQQWVAFVGKGVCFDSGGLDIKAALPMKDMYLDKHGACSILAAFQTIVEEKIKINLTCSLGFVENFISDNAYRPSDIIKSRKGLTVEIGNTDAEGRLVLADCMNWTQQHYKTAVLIQLSTLTGAIIIALGSRFAGLFSNNAQLAKSLKQAGQIVHQECWEMPVNDYHKDLVCHPVADITNHSYKPEASSSQAAAFLRHFVEQNTKWIHLDIAGVTIVGSEGTGFGARILIQYARNYQLK